MATPTPANNNGKNAGLIGLVGLLAASILYTTIPKEESGGKVYLNAYRDIVGVWTICDGDTTNVRPGMVETKAGCQARLEKQLIAHAAPVLKCVPGLKAKGREYTLAASVSLAYNIGTAGFCRSTAAKHFNAGRWRQGCNAFAGWSNAGGRKVQGLVNRRNREIAICLKGVA